MTKRLNAQLEAENERLRKDAERFKRIRELCGYVEDGSSQSLTITQDDATRTWIIKGGKKEISCGDSLAQAIDAALEKQ